MAKKRKEKELPIYMESSEKFSEDVDSIENSIQFIIRKQQAWNDRHQALIDDAEAEYRKDGNPMRVWDIFMLCRRDKWPIPEWVFEYLEESATRLLDFNNTAGNLSDALGFPKSRGGAAARKKYIDLVIRREAKAHTENYLRKNPDELVEAGEKHAAMAIKSRYGKGYFSGNYPEETVHDWINRKTPKKK